MTDLSLFDQTVLPNEQERAEGAGKRRTPLERLKAEIGQHAGRHSTHVFHPRNDKLWISRTGGTYWLSVRKGREQYRMEDRAVRQLAALLNVPAALLERLAGLPRVEDCRLLNMLMFAEGARPDVRFRCIVRDGKLARVHSGRFTSIDSAALVSQIERLENEGRARLRRFEITADGLWLEIEHSDFSAIDLSPVFNRTSHKADLWRPGAIFWNQEDGESAVTVVPVLFRAWGGVPFPVLASRSDVRRRRHMQDTGDALLRAAIGDLVATREAPFQQAAERFRALHEQFLPAGGVVGYLDSLNLPFPTKSIFDSVVRRVTGGRPTRYRLLTACLHEARAIENPSRRLRLLLALGRLAWTSAQRSKSLSRKNSR